MFDFLTRKFSSIISSLKDKTLSESTLNEILTQVQDSLLEADVPFELATTFTQELREKLIGTTPAKNVSVSDHVLIKVHEHIKAFLGYKKDNDISLCSRGTLLVMGLQGSGKTTTIAKLAYFIKKQAEKKDKKVKVLVASVDFYRPAAVDQLEKMAQKAEVHFYRAPSTNPLKAAQEIVQYAKKEAVDLLIVDTAGRMHIDQDMMKEIKELHQLISPTQTLLVLDAMSGQESLSVARSFNEAVGFDGAILSKFDSDSRGGAAFSFGYALNKPILFVGVGEKVNDLESFKADRLAGRILGMGDIESLAEKAEDKMSIDKQEAAYKALMSGKFTLHDFSQQMEMVQQLGSVSSILKYIPGMGSFKVSPEQLERGEKEMKKFKAIINSMTMAERLNHTLLNPSRINRITKGAGVEQKDVKLLIERFEQSRQYVTMFKKLGNFNNLFK